MTKIDNNRAYKKFLWGFEQVLKPMKKRIAMLKKKIMLHITKLPDIKPLFSIFNERFIVAETYLSIANGSLVLIFASLLLVSCTINIIPRDEIEIYEKGLDFWENGQYEMAIKVLTPYLDKDSLYAPLYTIIADSYYHLNKETELIKILDKVESLDEIGIVENLQRTFNAKKHRIISQQERVSFPQYVKDVADRYALDTALLYALIKEGSDFFIHREMDDDCVGIMGLTVDIADKIGLSVNADEERDKLSPFTYDDERIDPVKSIDYAVRYLHSLLEEYRCNSKNTDLIKALTTFYNPDKDSIDIDVKRVERVVEHFQYYRHNKHRQEEANRQYYEQNSFQESHFTSTYTLVPDEEQRNLLNEYKEAALISPLCFSEPHHQASYLNNVALICDMLDDEETADVFYKKALSIAPKNNVILKNYGQFLFDRGDYPNAYEILDCISFEDGDNDDVTILKGYCLLLTNRYDDLALYLEKYENEKLPHLDNLWGLLLFKTGNREESANVFYQAYEDSQEPVFAANYLAASFSAVFNNVAYGELTEYNKITRLYDTGFIWPIENRNISSSYGWRPNPFYKNWKKKLATLDFHNGIDLPGKRGSSVRASAAGEIIISERFPMGGESIFIKHPDGFITTYLHLDKRLVEVGDKVEQGDVVGLLGNTGQSTGPHLHFGMFDNKNRSANPLNYLPVYW